MKKLIFALIAVATLSLASCSKETRINNKLDGSWNVTQWENIAMPAGSSLTYEFNKGKKGAGSGKASGTGYFVLTSYDFSYQISDDKLEILHGTTKDSYTVTEYSSNNVTLTKSTGTVTKLEAK